MTFEKNDTLSERPHLNFAKIPKKLVSWKLLLTHIAMKFRVSHFLKISNSREISRDCQFSSLVFWNILSLKFKVSEEDSDQNQKYHSVHFIRIFSFRSCHWYFLNPFLLSEFNAIFREREENVLRKVIENLRQLSRKTFSYSQSQYLIKNKITSVRFVFFRFSLIFSIKYLSHFTNYKMHFLLKFYSFGLKMRTDTKNLIEGDCFKVMKFRISVFFFKKKLNWKTTLL